MNINFTRALDCYLASFISTAEKGVVMVNYNYVDEFCPKNVLKHYFHMNDKKLEDILKYNPYREFVVYDFITNNIYKKTYSCSVY